MDTKRLSNVISSLFFLTGTVLAVYAAVSLWKSTSPFPLTHAKGTVSATVRPTHILIPDIGLQTPVSLSVPTQDKKKRIPEDGAAFVIPPDTSENVVYYGHRWNAIFGKLPKSTPGMKIYVLYSDGTKRIYTIISTQTLQTNQTGVLKPSTVPKITLYTCTGVFDQNRFVAVGSLDNI